jgi:hypothetical protein
VPLTIAWTLESKLALFQLSGDGIEHLGEIDYDSSDVLRSLRIGDLLFSLTTSEIQVHRLTDPSVQVGRLDLPAPPPVPL